MLLKRNLNERLGAKRGGAQIKEHPFFNGLDWKKVYNKEIPPLDPKTLKIYRADKLYKDIEDEHTHETDAIPNWSFVRTNH